MRCPRPSSCVAQRGKGARNIWRENLRLPLSDRPNDKSMCERARNRGQPLGYILRDMVP